jgi:hypothetical protein
MPLDEIVICIVFVAVYAYCVHAAIKWANRRERNRR